jgi:hypothetical protein
MGLLVVTIYEVQKKDHPPELLAVENAMSNISLFV